MDKYEGAVVGDEVVVTFLDGEGLRGRVSSVPGSMEPWVIIGKDGTITYVMLFETLTVVSRKIVKEVRA